LFSAKILNDLGLWSTQKQDFVEAKKYFIEALQVLESASINNGNTHLEAVIHQNLGAILNFQLKFDEAIKHHKKAKTLYGKHFEKD